MYFISWNSAANIETEIIAQMLAEKVGWEKAREIFPLNLNPDDQSKERASSPTPARDSTGLNFASDKTLLAFGQDRPLQIGSNNWVTGPQLSPGEKPGEKVS